MRKGTIRTRLALLYSGLFLLAAIVMLVTLNLLLRNMLDEQVADLDEADLPPLPTSPPSGTPGVTHRSEASQVANDLSDAVQRFQWITAAAAIVVLAVVSLIGGWWLVGRMLKPLHHITTTAQRLSMSTLHERIALAGPRDELTRLSDTFDAMLDRLEHSVDSQRRFIANASHELRTPLAVQRAAIQIGLDEPTPERLVQLRHELLAANERAERLIEGLLTLAQSEHGLDHSERLRLDELVRHAVAEIDHRELTVAVDARPTTVSGDPVLLSRLVTNLLDNATRYNRPGGRVDVSVTADGTLTVDNTGPVIPDDHVDALFEPFRRLSDSRTRSTGGSGLGLSIVASIAEAHRARLAARPHPDGGLRVTVGFNEARVSETRPGDSRPGMPGCPT